MPFAGYDDWKEGLTYSQGSVVYYKTYLYVAMTNCDAGDNPLTATYTESFDCGDFGFNKVYPSLENPSPENIYTRTMRKWTIFDLPFGYYYSKLCGLPKTPLSALDYANVGSDVMVVNFHRPGGASGPEPEDPKIAYNWTGYGLTHGLNSQWPEPTFGELVYHISFVPLAQESTTSIMPRQYGDETVSGFAYQSHLYQEGTAVFFQNDPFGGGNGIFETVNMAALAYASFSRTHNFSGSPSGTASINSPDFADNYTASIPELPETDPPTSWTLTGISPDHPD